MRRLSSLPASAGTVSLPVGGNLIRRVELNLWVGRVLPYAVLVLPALAVCHTWLAHTLLMNSDWPAITMARQKDFLPFPAVIDTVQSLGNYNLFYSPETPLYLLQGLMAHLGGDFAMTERVIWYFPAVLLGLVTTYALCLRLTGFRWWSVLGAWLYTFNSYNLVLLDRGDVAMSAAHALLPLILLLWIYLLDTEKIPVWTWLLMVLAMAAELAYDLRVTYITILTLALWAVCWLLDGIRTGSSVTRLLGRVLARGGIVALPVILLESWWLLPGLRVGVPPLPATSGGTQWVSDLSFAQTGDVLALAHPFWPSDWYFVTYPIEPLFLAVPVIVAAIFLFRVWNRALLFFVSLALISVFLAKGSNDPAGGVYPWLYVHVPGFSLFREPLKFYHGLELAFAVLFTFAAGQIAARLSRLPALWGRFRGLGPWLALCTVAVLIPAAPALGLFGQSFTGTLSPSSADANHHGWPQGYVQLDRLLQRQPYSRVLWLPTWSNYWVSSEAHPALGGMDFGQTYFPGLSEVGSWRWFSQRTTPRLMQLLSVRYVAVDFDPRNVEYSYLSPTHGASWYIGLCRQWLRGWHERRLGTITLFQNPHILPRVFLSDVPRDPRQALSLLTLPLSHSSALALPSPHVRLHIQTASTTGLEVTVPRLKHSMLLALGDLSSPLWHVSVQAAAGSALPADESASITASHQQVNGFANGWILPAGPGYRVTLSYYPQTVTDQGALVSVLTLLACIGLATAVTLWRSLGLRMPAPVMVFGGRKVRSTEVA